MAQRDGQEKENQSRSQHTQVCLVLLAHALSSLNLGLAKSAALNIGGEKHGQLGRAARVYARRAGAAAMARVSTGKPCPRPRLVQESMRGRQHGMSYREGVIMEVAHLIKIWKLTNRSPLPYKASRSSLARSCRSSRHVRVPVLFYKSRRQGGKKEGEPLK
jgi:hypothetical protein